MSRLRSGTCGEPGPYGTHCTSQPGHRYSCYDAGQDSSWNDRFPEDWQTETPHACQDTACTQRGASVEGRTGEAIRQGFHRQEQMNPGDNRG